MTQSGRFREALSVALIVALSTTMLAPVFRGDWPTGHDHPVHLFRIWQLGETLRHGVLPWSWSHRWFAGYPQNVVYPIGADLLVLGVRCFSLGFLGIGQAYGIAFWLFYSAFGYAIYFFVRRVTRSRVAGLIATLFALTDPGSNEVGGWFWVVDVGVWTSVLGLVPALIGTVRLAQLLEKPGPAGAAAVSLCFALAVLCHQIHFIFFGLIIPLLCLSRFLAGEKTDWPRALGWLTAGLVTGIGLASFWYIPYWAALPYAGEIGAQGRSIAQLGDALASGTLFPRMHFVPFAFGLVGSVAVLRTRQPLAICTGLFIFTAAIASSSTITSFFGSAATDWMRHHITADRVFVLIKPFWYAAAGFAIVTTWRTAAGFVSESETDGAGRARSGTVNSRRLILVSICVLLVAPFAGRVLYDFYRSEIRRPTQWHSQRRDERARRQFVDWMHANVRPDEFGRVAHGFDFNDHDLTDLGIDEPILFYKIWPTPTGHFKYDINAGSNAALRAVNVRFALAKHPLDRPDFTLETVFDNQLWLYRFHDWNPAPFEIEGAVNVALIRFDPEEVLLRADSGAYGRLRLNVSYFPKWQATRDNRPIDIRSVGLPGMANSGFMETELRPGEYRFRFRRTFTDYAGTILSLIGLTAWLLLKNERLLGKLVNVSRRR